MIENDEKIYNVNLIETELINIKDLDEDFNRRIHKLNMSFSRNILGPLANWYNSMRNETAHEGLLNFFENLLEPLYVLHNFLQFDLENGFKGTVRFGLNSTVGIAGLYDFGDEVLGWERDEEDMGQTLAVWGVPAGYNIYLPLVGHMSTREAVGGVIDIFIDPLNSAWKHWIPSRAKRSATQMAFWGVKNFLYYSDRIELIETVERTSLDSYITFKEYIMRGRIADINDIPVGELVLDSDNFGEDLDSDFDDMELDDFDIE
ncbi:MAG: VacJ family lipoprotein [Alphaproteobacteria bacterium]|nr:VacJ family lipoprotein [Alphaproteobacteria bacterium]